MSDLEEIRARAGSARMLTPGTSGAPAALRSEGPWRTGRSATLPHRAGPAPRSPARPCLGSQEPWALRCPFPPRGLVRPRDTHFRQVLHVTFSGWLVTCGFEN